MHSANSVFDDEKLEHEQSVSESPAPSILVDVSNRESRPKQNRTHGGKTCEKKTVSEDAKSLVMKYAKVEHERQLELIQLKIDLAKMKKLKKEELYQLKIEAAKFDLTEAQNRGKF